MDDTVESCKDVGRAVGVAGLKRLTRTLPLLRTVNHADSCSFGATCARQSNPDPGARLLADGRNVVATNELILKIDVNQGNSYPPCPECTPKYLLTDQKEREKEKKRKLKEQGIKTNRPADAVSLSNSNRSI